MAQAIPTGRDECDAVPASGGNVPGSGSDYAAKNPWRPNDFKRQTPDRGHPHPAHYSHYLFLMNITHMIWKCNGCNKSSTDIRDTTCYSCSSCKFYLCKDCFEPRVDDTIHQHALVKTDVRCVYHASHGGWKCDCCGGNNGFENFLPRHCNICKFDLCEKCCQPQRSTLHLHDLYKANTELIYKRFSGGWRCDNCASVFHPSVNKFPNHCDICEFDLCDNCMRITDSKATRLSKPSFNRSPPAVTEKGHPVTSPQEDLVDLNGSDPDEALCIICLMRPKNATIVHGTSGHVCCCLECANTLQRRNDPCPICREPIQLVIQQYLV